METPAAGALLLTPPSPVGAGLPAKAVHLAHRIAAIASKPAPTTAGGAPDTASRNSLPCRSWLASESGASGTSHRGNRQQAGSYNGDWRA